MASSVLNLYDRLILERSRVIILFFCGLLALAAWQLPQFSLDASADSLLLEDDADLSYYREMRMHYPSGDEFLLVTFQPKEGDVFNPSNLALFKKLQDELAALESVKATNSILNLPLLHHEKMSLTQVEEYSRTLLDEDVDLEKARTEILSHPFYLEQLIDADAKTTAIQVVLYSDPELTKLVEKREVLRKEQDEGQDHSAEIADISLQIKTLNQKQVEQSEKTIDQIRTILKELEINPGVDGVKAAVKPFDKAEQPIAHPEAETFLGGVPMIVVDMVRFVQRDLQVFGGVVVFFLVLTLSLIFRQFGWVALALSACVSTSVLLTGFLSGIHFPITVISSNFVSLIFIITLSMIIHLIVRFRELRARYEVGGVDYTKEVPAHKELVKQTVQQMFWPCVYTSLTTVVAFMSLAFSRIRPVIDFGIMMSIGILCAFIVSFIFFPALLKTFPVKQKQQKAKGEQRAPFSLIFARMTQGLGNWLYVIILGLVGFSVFGLSILSVENRFIDYFKDDTEISKGMKLIDRQLGGTTPLDVVISFPELAKQAQEVAALEDERDCFVEDCSETPEAEPLLTMARIETLRKAQQTIESIRGVGKVLSIVSTLDTLAIANKGPLNGVEVALLDTAFPDEFRDLLWNPYISPDRYEFRFSLRIIDSDPELVRADLIRDIQTRLENEVGLQPDQVKVAGMLKLYNNMLESLFDSQIRTLGVVFFAILIMVALLFRSLRLAVVALLPNILAGIFVLGLMGWFGVSLDIMTITIAAICVGMAVDNSIHYIYRFREEYALVGDYDKAMWRSHGSIGRALYYTSMTIIVGFSILMLSSFKPTIYFGFFTSVAMCMALLGALTFLPRLMLTLKPLKKK